MSKKKRVQKKGKKSKPLKLIYVKNHQKVSSEIVKVLQKHDLMNMEAVSVMSGVISFYLANTVAGLLDDRNRSLLSRALGRSKKKSRGGKK